jgi:hypothetical protein
MSEHTCDKCEEAEVLNAEFARAEAEIASLQAEYDAAIRVLRQLWDAEGRPGNGEVTFSSVEYDAKYGKDADANEVVLAVLSSPRAQAVKETE